MHVRILLFALALSIATTGSLFASNIYKWTDEEGNVHYGDLPTGAAGEERLAIPSRPTNTALIQARVQAQAKARTRRAEAAAAIAAQQPTAEELRAQSLERQEKCTRYRERQTAFTRNRRIYKMDENGERVYYDEEQMADARTRVDELVKQYCN